MAQVLNSLEILSTRSGFNSAVRHIKRTIGVAETVSTKANLADTITELGADPSVTNELSSDRINLMLSMLLIDKLGYESASVNLESLCGDINTLAQEFEKWKAVDLVVAYHHPDLGLVIANPKRPEQLTTLGGLRKRELLVFYVGRFEKGTDDLCRKAAEIGLSLFQGIKVKIPESLYKGEFAVKKLKKPEAESKAKGTKKKTPVKAKGGGKIADKKTAVPEAPVQKAAVSAAPAPVTRGPMRMTPMYSVVVQNELFHNGNVEAWKRIIDSYKTKYPALEVYVYYDGERIVNLNSLFKWGKVKHGSSIQFAVAGAEIKDVAKLQRYLIQGASHQFEAFLHGPVSTALKLF